MLLKRSIIYIVGIALVLGLVGCVPPLPQKQEGHISIVTSAFPAYDFARNICADAEFADVTMLLPPGSESHTYEPTTRDIMAVQNCDLLIRVGGESEVWLDTILASLDSPVRVLSIIDCVGGESEEFYEHSHEGHNHDDDYDEHVWTSPKNAAVIVQAVGGELCSIDPENAAIYSTGAAEYANDIMDLDSEFRAFFETVQNKTLIFGDRFPFKHFAGEYGLTCHAAYPGCAAESEPAASTIKFLIDTVRTEQIPTVYYIEFSNHVIADSIAEATGADTALLHSCHNVTALELENGATYVSLMRRNLETLKATMR